MNFTNLNFFTLLVFLGTLSIIWFIVYKSYFKQLKFNKNFYLLSSNKYFYIKYIFLLLSLIILLFSIFWMRYWDKKDMNENPWIDTIFVLDVSKSMNVADILWEDYRYTRLDVIKDSISEYVVGNESDRFWLVIFAWDAISTIPLTIDHDIFLTFLQNVDYRNLTKQGSDFEKALQLWISRFNISDKRSKVLVFVSDWWDKDDNINYNNIKKLSEDIEWINYAVIWVWTINWWKIITWRDPFWRIQYQTFQWQYVNSTINKKNLKEISSALDWEYFELEKVKDMEKLSKSFNKLEKKSLDSISTWDKKAWWRILSIISFIFFNIFLLLYIFENKIYTFNTKWNE